MTAPISSIQNAELKAKLRSMEKTLSILRAQVASLIGGTDVSSGEGLQYIGEYAGSDITALPTPTSDPKVAKLNQQGSGYGDEYFISGRKGNGTLHWNRISGFPDS